jgi:hypothetical protein
VELAQGARKEARYVPVPSSSITCGFDEALSMMVMVPCTAPFLVGENVALILQFAPGATEEPQVDVTANSVLAGGPLKPASGLSGAVR